jgi:serine protease Do
MEKMMKRLVFGLLVLICGVWQVGCAMSGDLQLSGTKRWLTVASTKDKNVAIGIARQMGSLGDKTQVVSSSSGYFAVILGPYEASSIAQLKKQGAGKFDELPKDALLSQGGNYTEVVWTAAPATMALVSFTLTKPANFSVDGLQVKVLGQTLGAASAYTQVTGTDKSGASFSFDIGKDFPPDQQSSAESYMSEDFHKAGLVKLTKEGDPQIVVTEFSGGAHCCTSTWILNRPPGAAAWSLIEAEQLDGDGYWVEDVDGDGGLELLSADNHFFYAFDSYAGSFAPLKISQLQNGKLQDVTDRAEMRDRLVQDLANMEFSAKINPDLWKSNGFLVAWVASKIRLGDGDEAWAKFMASYDKNSDFGPQICTTGQKVDDCPAGKLKAQPIPEGFAEFLEANGYYPLPRDAAKLIKN